MLISLATAYFTMVSFLRLLRVLDSDLPAYFDGVKSNLNVLALTSKEARHTMAALLDQELALTLSFNTVQAEVDARTDHTFARRGPHTNRRAIKWN